MTQMSNTLKTTLIALGGGLLFAAALFLLFKEAKAPEVILPDVVPQRASLSGTYLCLPHTDTRGPQTEECAGGIKTDDGTYYAIDFNLMSQSMPPLASGNRISANGTVTPIEMISSNMWQKYPIKGIFSVTDSLEIK